jgi:hypothetical protein
MAAAQQCVSVVTVPRVVSFNEDVIKKNKMEDNCTSVMFKIINSFPI